VQLASIFFSSNFNPTRITHQWDVEDEFQLCPKKPQNIYQLLQSGPLVVHCKLEMRARTVDDTLRSPSADCREALHSLFHDSASYDVMLTCAANGAVQQVGAHKLVLGMRSPVFKAMFNTGMKEAALCEVLISDIEHTVLQALVRFMYTDTCDADVLRQHVSDLLVSAVKYQVPALQSKCEQFIAAHTTTVNVIDVLHLAELHQSSFLKSRALSVVVGNIKGLLQQDGFMDGIKDGLWHDIMRAMVAVK
jgi:hypothetical protein